MPEEKATPSGSTPVTNTPWTEEEKETIVGLVKAAMGYNEARGDSVYVGNMPFEAAVEEDEASEIEATKVVPV